MSQEDFRQEERKLLGFRRRLMRPAEGGEGLHQAVPHPTQPPTGQKAKQREMQHAGSRPETRKGFPTEEATEELQRITEDASRGKLWNVLPRQ